MILDKSTISDEMDAKFLAKLIHRHMTKTERYSKLRNYYRGEHEIKNRHKASSGTANNKVVCNHAKYITDMVQSYLVGNAVTYAASEGYDIEAVKNAYLVQDIASLDSELVKDMSIYGHAYELIYANEEAEVKSARISPEQAFIVYDDDCEHSPLLGVHYYKTQDVDGNVTGVVCNAYDAENIYKFEADTDNWDAMTPADTTQHYFGGVPLIEYINNSEKQGDFEQLIPLIDAYNTLMSDRVNDKEQFVDAFLFLSGIDIDSEQAQKLRDERILMGYEGAEAKYLSKVLSETDMKVLRDNLKDDIHRFSMVPDLSDESFGNNLSGVAIKYKLMGFEQHVKNKERSFTKSLKRRFELYVNFLSTKGTAKSVPVHRVDFIFKRNLPVNNLEIAQMIEMLDGKATQETLLSQLDFVGDPKEEAKLVKAEHKEKAISSVKEIQDMAELGY